MTMHAAVNRGSMAENGGARFFASVPDVANDVAPLIRREPESRVFSDHQGPNWPAIVTIVGLHLALLFALIKLDVIHVQKPQVHNLTVFDLSEPAPPPMIKPEPVKVVEKVVPKVLAPVAMVQTLAPPPPPVQVTNTPPPPKVVVVAPPAGPPAPTVVSNLDERRISGNPPRYPMESRRKKEQGTVVLRLVIGTDGRIENIGVAQSSGFDRLDQAALDAVRGWRWQPILQNGSAIPVRGVLSIPFVIAGKA